MSQITMAEWGRQVDAGAVTYTVGEVTDQRQAFTDPESALAAAIEERASYIRWDGSKGRQVTPDFNPELEDPELS